jgi:hypothetical protein
MQVEILDGKRQLGRTKHRQEGNIETFVGRQVVRQAEYN